MLNEVTNFSLTADSGEQWIPVALLCWTQSDIEQHTYFRNDEGGRQLDTAQRKSMYDTLDQLFLSRL